MPRSSALPRTPAASPDWPPRPGRVCPRCAPGAPALSAAHRPGPCRVAAAALAAVPCSAARGAVPKRGARRGRSQPVSAALGRSKHPQPATSRARAEAAYCRPGGEGSPTQRPAGEQGRARRGAAVGRALRRACSGGGRRWAWWGIKGGGSGIRAGCWAATLCLCPSSRGVCFARGTFWGLQLWRSEACQSLSLGQDHLKKRVA